MAVEDLHWIDKSSEASLRDLLDSIAGARVLLVFTYRPEFVHTWGGRSFHSQVNLNRLSNRESLIFIEEFIKSLRDLQLIERKDNTYHLTEHVQDVAMPATIQAVIMARVDLLPEGAREVLQIGSVIEREFSYDLIKRVTDHSEQELLSDLSVLKDSELLYERGIFPQSIYVFKHAVTREVVYESILKRRKKKLHEEIGTAIEELDRESLDEQWGVLAEHFIESENYEKGAEYSRLAERKAEKTASLSDAVGYAKKRITCLERLPKTDDVIRRIIDARTVLGLYFIQISYHIEAKEAVDPIIDLALKSDYKRRLSQIYTILGVYSLMIEEDFPTAFKHLGVALKISEKANDVVSSFFANDFLGVALSFDTEFEKALCHFEKALEINEAANNLWGTSVVKSQIGYFVYNLWGRLGQSCQTTDEAIGIAEESGDTYSKAFAYTTYGISCQAKGLFEEAAEHLSKGILFFERIGYFAWDANARFYLGENCFEIGDFEKSKGCYDRAIRSVEPNGTLPSFVNLCKIGLARAKVMSNEKDVDLEALHACVHANRMRMFDGWMRRYMGEILLEVDDHHKSEAEEWLLEAIRADKRNGMMLNLGSDYLVYADLFKRRGHRSEARENLDRAVEIFRECGADGWVEKAEKELAALS
jgi:tetratricopeptide (TPR) repeat protein